MSVSTFTNLFFSSLSSLFCALAASCGDLAAATARLRISRGTCGPGTASRPHENQLGGYCTGRTQNRQLSQATWHSRVGGAAAWPGRELTSRPGRSPPSCCWGPFINHIILYMISMNIKLFGIFHRLPNVNSEHLIFMSPNWQTVLVLVSFLTILNCVSSVSFCKFSLSLSSNHWRAVFQLHDSKLMRMNQTQGINDLKEMKIFKRTVP